MLRDRITVQGNTGVNGNGGGVCVRRSALAGIASPGYLNVGAIYDDTALLGGGLALKIPLNQPMLRCGVATVEKSLVLRYQELTSWGGRTRRGSNARRVFLLPWMACMPATQDDCMDAGGRATQEQLPSSFRRFTQGIP